MKRFLSKISILSVFLFSSYSILAQNPATDFLMTIGSPIGDEMVYTIVSPPDRTNCNTCEIEAEIVVTRVFVFENRYCNN